MTIKLSAKTLPDIAAKAAIPTYDRAALTPGIIHIGVGNFHRAHQAVYLDDYLRAGGDPSWGILGAGVREADARMRDLLSRQDWMYSVVEVDDDRRKASIIGAMTGFVPVQPQGAAALIAAMSDPAVKIVSLTVTEGGYFLDGDGAFNPADAAVAQDIKTPRTPGTAFGAILAALAARKAAGAGAFTVMSCDNLPGNGHIAHDVVVGMAKAMDPEFGKWVDGAVTFPNGMVDRITPATGPRERQLLRDELGIEDAFPVFCEPFRQWVLEDKFVAGRPELETVGVTFTDDIESFEKMKIRILNGGHAILAYASAMLGIEFAHEAMRTPLILAYLRKVLEDDVLPLVPGVPGFTPQAYMELICKRFANPGVADTIARLCHDGSNRQPKFIVGSVRDNLTAGKSAPGLALSSALWCQYCLGRNDRGDAIAANDPNWGALQAAARRAQDDPGAWLAQDGIYGAVGRDEAFRALFAKHLKSLQANGSENAIRAYLDGTA